MRQTADLARTTTGSRALRLAMRRLMGAALVLAVSLVPLTATAGDKPARMLTILSSGDTETQAMALVLSNQAAKAGVPVHLLLCGPAGDIALDTPPQSATKVVTPKGMSVRSLLQALMAKGGKVDVCAIYLPNRKLKPAALIDGVAAAKPPVIAAEMIDPRTKLAIF